MERTVNESNRGNLRKPLIPSGVIGMMFLISTEIMLFSGFISGFLVNQSERPGAWAAPWEKALPVEQTSFNTVLLLLSAVSMFLSIFYMKRNDLKKMNSWLILTAVLGTLFVGLQGREWMALISFGMTTSSSLYGAFFYMIIGAHGLHVSLGVLLLLYLLWKTNRSQISVERKSYILFVGSLYWYFVVFLWPVLYYLVYFS